MKKKSKTRTTQTTKTKTKYRAPAWTKFKAGQAVVFEPYWAQQDYLKKNKKIKVGDEVYPGHPLKYGDIVHFLAHMTPAYGHCIIVDYDGKVTTMLHPSDFRLATDEEV